jgi:nucleoside-diphosphate kinase
MQHTLVLIKPDAIQRGLVGNIVSRFELKGLKLCAMKMQNISEKTWEEHYSHIADKPFFPPMKDFMTSTPIICMVWQGKEAIDVVRMLAGATNSRQADVGTIRGDLSMSIQYNVVHASDSPEAAEDEISRFFEDGEVLDYDKTEFDHHLYTGDEKGE